MSDITRRDFVNGALVLGGAAALSGGNAVMASLDPEYYPPTRTGLRGSHPGSNDAAHDKAWAGRMDWGNTTDTQETYDLVVVGGGLSGLSAAYFYQKKHGTDKKILILDNHDDFGGHAKRNEHWIDGQMRIGQGGSESYESPWTFNDTILNMIKDIGCEMDRFESAYDTDFYRRHNLRAASFFNKRTFGEDKVVLHPFADYLGFIEGLLRPELTTEEAVAQTPLSARGKEQLLRVMNGGQHAINVPKEKLKEYARSTLYFDYLRNDLGIDDEQVLTMARHTSLDYGGGGTDALKLRAALATGVLGGDPYDNWSDVLDPGDYNTYINKEGGAYTVPQPFIHHFPDGNAGTARLLVKKMIPNVTPVPSGENIVMAKFDYSQLDKASNAVRLRLNSTGVHVKHLGDPKTADEVSVTYIQKSKAFVVKAKGVVLACYNKIIPHIVPGLPEDQDAALRKLTKVPLQYSTVGLRNWRAIKELGIGYAMCPGNMHSAVGMDFPVSIGGYEYTKTPDDPCILHMRCAPRGDNNDIPRVQQFKEARYKMLSLTFDDYEAEIREHLTGMLGGASFKFDRDVSSITVNRWAHGYSHGNPGPVGRQPFGRITIANSDSVGSALFHVAAQQAYRAVEELS